MNDSSYDAEGGQLQTDKLAAECAQLRAQAAQSLEREATLRQSLEGAQKRLQELERSLNLESAAHHDDSERAVIGAVLLDNRAYYEIATILRGGGDFYRESHRTIWRAIEALIKGDFRGADLTLNPVDVITVSDYLNAVDLGQGSTALQAVGGPNALARYANEVPSAANCAYYARIVRRYADLRRLVSFGQRLESKARDKDRRPDELISEIVSELLELAQSAKQTTRNAVAIDDDLVEKLKSDIAGESKSAVSTGIQQLDKMLKGGIHDGRSIYIGGLTKMGKTTLAIAIAGHMMFRHDYAIDWVSVEMSDVEIEEKFLAYRAGINFDAYREAERYRPLDKATIEARELIHNARLDWRRRDINVEVKGAPNTVDIEMMARSRVARLGGRRKYALIVDYLQNCHNGNSRQSENDRISEASKRLNGISKDLQVPVFVLFQFDKEAEKTWLNARTMPRFSNLRGSSQAGNDSNHFLILHRNWRDKPEAPENERYTEILQDLSRHGNLGYRIELDADLATNRFKSWSGDLPPAALAYRGVQNGANQSSGSAIAVHGLNRYTGGADY